MTARYTRKLPPGSHGRPLSATGHFITLLAISVIEDQGLLDDHADWAILLAAAIIQVGVAVVWTPLSVGYTEWLHLVFPPWTGRLFGPTLP